MHVEVESQPKRHIVNYAELTTITIALDNNKQSPSFYILNDNVFNIETRQRYAIDSLNFIHHSHKDFLHLADKIIHQDTT